MERQLSFRYFFLVSWGGVKMSPLGTSTANWPIVKAVMPDGDECGAVNW
jgi:hypothetical protein